MEEKWGEETSEPLLLDSVTERAPEWNQLWVIPAEDKIVEMSGNNLMVGKVKNRK